MKSKPIVKTGMLPACRWERGVTALELFEMRKRARKYGYKVRIVRIGDKVLYSADHHVEVRIYQTTHFPKSS